jgi:isopentenyl-diphosphate Delta-isomerase
MTENLILVDEEDRQIGTGEKMAVHREGRLHRCFSIFIFNRKKQVLLQKRSQSKYHSGGLWTNTCCGHPLDGEPTEDAASRRLEEEMGFHAAMKEVFSFIYKARLDSGLMEHEYDHVFVGQYDGVIAPNPEEADGFEWEDVDFVESDMDANPERYTVWSKIAFRKLLREHSGALDEL